MATTGDERPVFFFDIDNCLYPKSAKVHDEMKVLINQYFREHLNLSEKDAYDLHEKYYTQYGLAIEGLVRHNKVDALEYNKKVDDALPLDRLIRPDPRLRELLEDLDTTKIKPWLFTNAYVTHGERVAKILNIRDLFSGITFCNYAEIPFVCKPHTGMYAKAMEEAGVPPENRSKCYFVDDSESNVRAAEAYGWNAVHLSEATESSPGTSTARSRIESLQELRQLFPQFFKSTN